MLTLAESRRRMEREPEHAMLHLLQFVDDFRRERDTSALEEPFARTDERWDDGRAEPRGPQAIDAVVARRPGAADPGSRQSPARFLSRPLDGLSPICALANWMAVSVHEICHQDCH